MLLYIVPALPVRPPAQAKTEWRPDTPSRTETWKDADGDEVTCTYYPDLVLRQTQTNTPSPGRTTLARIAASPARSRPAAGGRALDTSGFSFAGRKGPWLFFEEADPNGSTAFMVFDARDGRKILSDASLGAISQGSALRRFVSTPDMLSVSYRRGLNTSCSILARPATCWRMITRMRGNAVPHSIARLGPPVHACRVAYSFGKVGGDDPSVISYEVKVIVTRRGVARMQASGPIGCTPLP